MTRTIGLLALAGLVAGLAAHPMGNFSISHYTRLQPGPRGVAIVYVLDLAEIPTFELLRDWKLDAASPRAELQAQGLRQEREWAKKLVIKVDGQPVPAQVESADFVMTPGAGNMPVLRITARLRVPTTGGQLEYEDTNFPDRAGWKEIVIAPAAGVSLREASQDATERSKGLTDYPADPTVAPPQDVRARLSWSVPAAPAPEPVITQRQQTVPTPVAAAPVITPVPQPKSSAPPAPPSTNQKAATPAGTVTRGDYLSRLLSQRDITLGMALIGIAVAFAFGAMHALSPGHGKTIVAAYLVGTRGTVQHALFLGGMVTFTHTISVFALGLGVLFFEQYVVPEQIYPILGAISGLSIVIIGALLLRKRLQALRGNAGHHHHHDHSHAHTHDHAHDHSHTHSHDHGQAHSQSHDHVHSHKPAHVHAPAVVAAHSHTHEHGHSHDHGHANTHSHDHGGLVHDHGDGNYHSHVPPEGKVTLGSLIALGVSGGLVPCPSALVLLLSAVAIGRTGLGLILLISFSLGLAIVLMAIGVIVIYAKHLLPDREQTARHPAFRLIPIGSAVVVMCLGLLMTAASLGYLPRIPLLGG